MSLRLPPHPTGRAFERRLAARLFQFMADRTGTPEGLAVLRRQLQGFLATVMTDFQKDVYRARTLEPYGRRLHIRRLAQAAGIRLAELDAEGDVYRVAVVRLRAAAPGKPVQRVVQRMEACLRLWNTTLGEARRVLRAYGWRAPTDPQLRVLPGGQAASEQAEGDRP